MLFNLLLASITFLRRYFQDIFIIPLSIENTRVKLALAFPAEAPITLPKEIIDTPPLVADKTIKVLSK